MKKVCMVLTNGFEEVEAVGTFAVLRRAGLTVDIFSLVGTQAIGRFGLTCAQVKPFSQLDAQVYDALVLPGGPQYQALEKSDGVQALLHQFIASGKVVAAICASPTILGRAGYLKGKTYTCFTSMNEDFGGHFTGQYVAVDGNLITGQSAAASIDFGFAIVEKLLGAEKATQVKQSIYYK
ncbi:MAG: DJ-1/PfpI family protein, partial [Elusimicrobiaceae bacterium]|nr:DJ-1/PfpI family protein [Elusimicrobiaceae bacterium]